MTWLFASVVWFAVGWIWRGVYERRRRRRGGYMRVPIASLRPRPDQRDLKP